MIIFPRPLPTTADGPATAFRARSGTGPGKRLLLLAPISLAFWACLPCLPWTALPACVSAESVGLRQDLPVEQVVADLRGFIGERMSQEQAPGLSIALIREGEIVWAEGFGVANSMTGRPVTKDTVFEVASISKVVTAYAALRLVEEDFLSLDEPVSGLIETAWMAPSDWGERITVRHLASHSSGLGDNLLLLDKEVGFEPGSEFCYSGLGFLYLQHVIEQTTRESLEGAVRRLVFDPLGMSSSSFVNREPVWSKMANGHLNCQLPALIFLVPFLAGLGSLTMIAKITLKIVHKSWKIQRRQTAVLLALASLSTVLFLSYVGRGLPHLVLLSLFCGVAFLLIVAVLLKAAEGLLALPQSWGRRLGAKALIAAVVGWAVLFAASFVRTPIPTWPSPAPSAVGSLRTTSGDLALLLIELTRPRLVGADLASQLKSPQIEINEHFSWGLGIGIQHSAWGDALWQNGNTFGFKSVIVIYPVQNWGVVVLTNGHEGQGLAYDIAHRALGGEAFWKDF